MISCFEAQPGEVLEILYPKRPALQTWQQGDFSTPLTPYRHTIQYIMNVIGGGGCCVEFGAWDGIFALNTRSFIIEEGWRACLIEGNRDKFNELVKNYAEHSGNVVCVNRMIDFQGTDRLDCVLEESGFSVDEIKLMVIDIDGNDYHVWESLERYAPDVVMIEYNYLIPNDIVYVQPRDLKVSKGASLEALVRLGRRKGYELVAAPSVDAFFVKKEFYPMFNLKDNSPNALNHNDRYLTRVFQTYDGELVCAGYNLLKWDQLPFEREDIQPLPKSLRRYCGPGQVKLGR